MPFKAFTALLFAVAVFITVSFRQIAVEPNGYFHSTPFKFTLLQSAATSAGVYTTDGVLVRTLWSGVKYASGTHSAIWDGTNDEGNLLPAAPYQVKVLSNNVKYTWEGVIGNTSGKLTGPTIFRGHNYIKGLAIAGNTAFYTVGYNEQGSSCLKFNTQDAEGKTTIGSGGIESSAATTDGKLVYWVSYEIKTNSNFIQATQVANDAPVTFTAGQAFTVYKSKAHLSVLENAAMPDAIKAIAVQKNGRYLLSAHTHLNQVHVLDKITGKLVSTVSITNPNAIAVDQKNHAWVACMSNGKPSVCCYQINADGGLQYINKFLPGLVKPLAIALSPDDATVLVADGGSSQQLKAYDNSSAQLKWAFGETGGYMNSAAVNDRKFYFSDVRNELGTSLAFSADGSFWVEDSGNSRLQHYSANRVFINRVMYLPTSYSVTVDRNDASRVFSDYLEFKIDYAKPLSQYNGSWTLVNNWGATVPKEWDRAYNRLKDVVTLKNGRTYAFLGRKGSKTGRQVIELTSQHSVRFCGKTVPMDYSMDQEGDMYHISAFKLGVASSWLKLKLTGFDQDNNPLWGNENLVAATQSATINDPLMEGNGTIYGSEKTSTNVFVAFNQRASVTGSARPHLGGVKLGDHKWLWQTAIGTHRNYRGDFPADGAFDNGNRVHYAGSMAVALDRSIFWGYYGEFWKNSETNKWNQVYDDGLFIGQFGTTGAQITEKEGAAMMAGNAMAASVVKDADGNMYLYHNDEGTHSGVHRWKISNMGSVAEQVIKVTLANTKHGLLAEYFKSPDLDNLNLTYVGVNPLAAFGVKQIPSQANSNNKGELMSVRLSGYLRPASAASYTFTTNNPDNMRVWIGDKLVADNWAGKANQSKPIALNGDTSYPIKIEFKQSAGVQGFTLLWSANGQAATAIPTEMLWPAELPQQANAVDLLAGLPFDGILEDGLYGWERGKSAEDYTNRYGQFLTVLTNKRVYNKRSSPDLFASFRQGNSIKTVTRNLGNNKPLNQWKINAVVNFEGNSANDDTDLTEKGSGGSFLEVLDNTGKVITRIFFHADKSTDASQLYANNQVIINTNSAGINKVMRTSQPLSIQVEKGICTFQYGSYPVVKAPVFDPASRWTQPKTFRVYFWCKTRNLSRAIDIENMSYSFK